MTHFAVFGYHVTGSTGTLFLYGIVTGALAIAGLCLLLAGARRTSRRGRDARRGLARSRRETAAVSQERDDLIGQRDTARGYTVHDEQQNFTASTPDSARRLCPPRGTRCAHRGWHPNRHRPHTANMPNPAAQPEPPAGQAAAVPAGPPAAAR